MKFKSLILPFGFRELVGTCGRKGWMLPFKSELESIPRASEHKCFWVADVPVKVEDRDTHAYLYCTEEKALILVNKNFKKNAVVVVKGR